MEGIKKVAIRHPGSTYNAQQKAHLKVTHKAFMLSEKPARAVGKSMSHHRAHAQAGAGGKLLRIGL